MNTENALLSQFLPTGIASTRSLILYADSEKYAYSVIRHLINEGYICRSKVKQYIITRKGIDYITSNPQIFGDFLRFYPNARPLSPRHNKSSLNTQRDLIVSDVKIFMQASGAQSSLGLAALPFLTSDETKLYKDEPRLENLMYLSQKKLRDTLDRFPYDNKSSVFLSAIELKLYFLQDSNYQCQTKYAQATGLLISPFDLYMVFHIPASGKITLVANTERNNATNVSKQWAKYGQDSVQPNINKAILIVETLDQISSMLVEPNNQQKKLKDAFKDFIIIPYNRIGVAYASALMNWGIKEMQKMIYNDAHIKYPDLIVDNSSTATEVFPLLYCGGKVFDGTLINLSKLFDAINYSIYVSSNFSILCYEWQTEFYSQCFKGFNLIIIPRSGIIGKSS